MQELYGRLKSDFSNQFGSHEDFFLQFFSTIQSYLAGSRNNLPGLVDIFFEDLLHRITQILLGRDSTDQYTRCVANQLKLKQPFSQTPGYIKNISMEAFPAVRLAINSMAFARETILAASVRASISLL